MEREEKNMLSHWFTKKWTTTNKEEQGGLCLLFCCSYVNVHRQNWLSNCCRSTRGLLTLCIYISSILIQFTSEPVWRAEEGKWWKAPRHAANKLRKTECTKKICRCKIVALVSYEGTFILPASKMRLKHKECKPSVQKWQAAGGADIITSEIWQSSFSAIGSLFSHS